MPSDQGLFDEFSPVTEEQWRAEAERSLKGAPLDNLARGMPEGFAMEPIAFPGSPPSWEAAPGEAPFVRGASAEPGWIVCQRVAEPSPESWNRTAGQALDAGVEALELVLDRAGQRGLDPADAAAGEVGRDGLSLGGLAELSRALQGLELGQRELVLQAGSSTPALCAMLPTWLQRQGGDPGSVRLSLGYDPLGELAGGAGRAEAMGRLLPLCLWAQRELPAARVLRCRGEFYAACGADAVRELAYALASGACYLRLLIEGGMAPDAAARLVELSFASGSRLLLEIAKLRAARLLWSTITEAFGCKDPQARAAHLAVTCSSWTLSSCDPWVNLLRGTVQAFAGAVGGAARITVLPFDAAVGRSNSFAQRLARNTQIVLRDESFLDRVSDPAGGSWTVEALTEQVARQAWSVLQQVESLGGMRQALQQGEVQRELLDAADRRREQVGRRQEPFVGVSVYPDPEERTLERQEVPERELRSAQRLERLAAAREGAADLVQTCVDGAVSRAAEAAAGGATLGQLTRALLGPVHPPRGVALAPWRAMAEFESLRQGARQWEQRSGKTLGVVVLCWGDARKVRPRLDWARGALQAAGIGVPQSQIHDSVRSALDAQGPPPDDGAVLVCAEDSAYADTLPTVVQWTGGRPVVVAGLPPEGDPGWGGGVQLFVNRTTDLARELGRLLQALGVSA